MPEREVRSFVAQELRAATREDGTRYIEGRAIPFGELSENLGGFREMMHDVTLADDLLMNFDHKSAWILGRSTSGTLKAEKRDDGVHFEVEPPHTTWAEDLIVSLERGDIRGCSFEMCVQRDDFKQTPDGIQRDILDAFVDALTITSIPAYPTTSAEARDKAAALVPEQREDAASSDDDAGPRPVESAPYPGELQAGSPLFPVKE
jgi:HK97 family phage prohead protease